ncbi:uncharacterized protein LOC118436741 isoform X1 [Folsomia candida]|uniref:uncharacterized protein LOC118436741 isoform X1 n=1 Tax=Folsomia candida TaxID=158441 RepID=UPI0016055D59|nr:uncharacterized protein LOC118436741 isoform X1 [Folsomia candida]
MESDVHRGVKRGWDVISVACSDHVGVALTSKGELFQWTLGDSNARKVLDAGCVPFKKITGTFDFIFALTVKGEMHYLDENTPLWRSGLHKTPAWKTVFDDHKIEDIASFTRTENLVVIKNLPTLHFPWREKSSQRTDAFLPKEVNISNVCLVTSGRRLREDRRLRSRTRSMKSLKHCSSTFTATRSNSRRASMKIFLI